jgi:hypothetical protein
MVSGELRVEIQKECDELMALCLSRSTDDVEYQQAYMAKQALAWLLDGMAKPSDVLCRWRENSARDAA